MFEDLFKNGTSLQQRTDSNNGGVFSDLLKKAKDIFQVNSAQAANAIRQTESQGNYAKKGASGEIGAYQFLPTTWQQYAPKFGIKVPLQKATKQQQDKVAQGIIEQDIKSGLSLQQIAAKWNSGSPLGWENKKGVNAKGVAYDVPGYVNKVVGAYNVLGGNIPNYPKPVIDPNLKIGAPTSNTKSTLPHQLVQENPVQSFAQSLLHAPFRAAQSVAQDYMNPSAATQPGGNVYTPQTPFQKAIFGNEPIKSVGTQYKEAQQTLKSGGLGRLATPLAILGVGGGTVMDLFPYTPSGESGKVIEGLAKATTQDAVESILKKAGTSEDLIKNFSGDLVKATTKEDVKSVLNKMKEATNTTNTTFNADNYVAEQTAKMQGAKQGGSTLANNISNLYKIAKTKLVDFASPIEDTLRAAEKKSKLTMLPQNDITNQIDRVLRSPTIAGQFARDNGLESVIKNTDNLHNLDQYLIAKQTQKVASNGIETGRNLSKDAELIKQFGPKYEQQAKVVTDYSKKLLDYSVDSGLISPKLAEALKQKYPDYVPIKRVFNELEKMDMGHGSKAIASLSKQTVIQKLVGSGREIESPIASLLEKTADVFKQGEKNKAAKMLASYEKLPGNPFNLRELKAGESAKDTISYLDNGVKRTFETTKDIADAAKALNVQQLNILGKIFAAPVRVARVGITGINLPFTLANVAKDQVTAFINSKNALRTSMANPLVFMKSLFEAVGHGEIYNEMAREGAMGTKFDIARNQVFPTIEKLRASRSLGGRILYTVKHPSELLRAAENIVNRGEEFTRIQQYVGTKKAQLAKGVGEEAARIGAARAARENTVNFARRGEWGQVLNSAFLYLNAGIQGTRTFLRNLKERPLQTATKLAISVFTPIATATAWNLSDPKRKAAYDDIAEYEKQNNIIIIPPNPTKDKDGNWNVIKIPLSQEINNLANLARRPIEQAYGKDPLSIKDIASALTGTLTPINQAQDFKTTAESNFVPQAIKPTLESFTNQNFFTGYPIVPDYIKGQSSKSLSPENQVKDNTSGTARKIGKVVNASPITVENWIRDTFGGIGSQALNASDRVLAGLNIIPKDQIGGQNVLKAITARFATARGGQLDEKSNNEIKNIIQKQADEGFRLQQEAEILYSELKKLPKDQANAKADQLQTSNPQLYDKLKNVVTQNDKGLDYNDRLMLQLGVTNGERAKFIWNNLKAFSTKDEKNNYVEELQRKGIISNNVFSQLQELRDKGY